MTTPVGNDPIEVPQGFVPDTSTGNNEPVVTPPASTEPVVTPAPVADAPYKAQLEQFPESLRPTAEKIFKEWDAGVNQRFEVLHSQLEPWKNVTESYDPDTVNQALTLAQALENDPKALWEALDKAYNLSGQGQPNQQQPQTPVNPGTGEPVIDPDDPYAATLAELKQGQALLAQTILAKQNEDTLAQANRQLDGIMTGLKEKHGNFDETYVYTLIANGVDPEAAVNQYKSAVNAALSANNTPAPVVVGEGGGQPAEPFDPKSMSPKDTKAYVVAQLAAAAAQGD